MNKKFSISHLINLAAMLVGCLLLNTAIHAQQNNNSEKPLADLFEDFNTARKLPCGERNEAIQTGRQIIEFHSSDEINQDFIRFVKKETVDIIEKDRICVRNALYDKLYKEKNWQRFFAISKYIIAEEGDNPLALDVILTLVSTGFDRAAIDKDDTFNSDTIYFAKLAIQKIEAGQKTKKGDWGAFEPFSTKENALGWMNFITRWFNSYKLNQKKEALEYFYKAVQNKDDNYRNSTVYLLIGDFYLREMFSPSPELNQTATGDKLLNFSKGFGDRALIAYARAYELSNKNIIIESKVKAEIYKRITEVCKFRFNLKANEDSELSDEFIEMLMEQPMPDLTTSIQPIFEEPFEIKIMRKKSP